MRHTLSFLIDNSRGELPRIVGLFSARGLGVETLTMAPTHEAQRTLITVVTSGPADAVSKLAGQVAKQVRVIEAREVAESDYITRELALIHVTVAPAARKQVGTVADRFGARAVETNDQGAILQASGESQEIDSLIEALRPLGLSSVARTGIVSIPRLTSDPAGEAAKAQ